MQAENQGLEAAKTDAFKQITDQSNRRGLLYSGVPIAEQAQYTGASFLPAVANLKAKYAQQKFNLQNALAGLDTEALKTSYGIYNDELTRDQAARAGAGGAAPSFGAGFGGGGTLADTTTTPNLRAIWQKEAQAGDWNAQVALNYAGNDGRYDGPVNSQNELNILKNMGIKGNYYLRKAAAAPSAPSLSQQANQQVRGGSSLVNQLRNAFSF